MVGGGLWVEIGVRWGGKGGEGCRLLIGVCAENFLGVFDGDRRN
jgi:hypothetical protein